MDALLSHWPFAAAALIFSVVGQVMKSTIWTLSNVRKYYGSWQGHLLWWGRKTLPMHPAIAGAALGLVPGISASPGVTGTTMVILYYAMAGVCSTWAFDVVRGVAKSRGIEIGISEE